MTPDQREEMRVIYRRVANDFGIEEADIYVRDRSDLVRKARWAAWDKCRRAGYSLETIAALANWNHTSVMHGIEKTRGRK